jgi:glycerol-3-phosphate acyltransferase PlsY
VDVGSLLVAVGVIVAAYLIGGIPWGIIVARIVGGPDPRTLGSGRTGGANVMRALGPRAALAAGLLDAAKGSVAVLLAVVLGTPPIVQVLAALAAILGHSRSPYIGFRGGRGVATAWGALLVIQPVVGLLAVPVFVGIVAATRISSLASLTTSVFCAIGLTVTVIVVPMSPAYLVFAIGGLAMIWLFHADNIQRLLAGQERRIDEGPPPAEPP